MYGIHFIFMGIQFHKFMCRKKIHFYMTMHTKSCFVINSLPGNRCFPMQRGFEEQGWFSLLICVCFPMPLYVSDSLSHIWVYISYMYMHMYVYVHTYVCIKYTSMCFYTHYIHTYIRVCVCVCPATVVYLSFVMHFTSQPVVSIANGASSREMAMFRNP